MNKILWTQNESPLHPDTIVVDGNICSDTKESQKAFNLLNEFNQQLALDPNQRDSLYKKFKDRGFSHQANYQVGLPGVYLQGCFLDQDQVGRKLPYMFYDAHAEGIADAAASLKVIAKVLGRRYNEDELKILELGSKSKKKSNMGLVSTSDSSYDSNINDSRSFKLKIWNRISPKKT